MKRSSICYLLVCYYLEDVQNLWMKRSLCQKNNVKLPEMKPSIIDLNRSMKFCNGMLEHVRFCLSHNSWLFLAHRAWFAVGIEHLGIVGFFGEPDKLKTWGKHYLTTLPLMLKAQRRSNFRDAALQVPS